uniref:Uncharacterized protein n=1 Tax=Romanomermis culicivorax TaxID=13658 RepID=A0A915K2R0_ROMCU
MTFFVKRRILVNEMAQMLWKIPYRDIVQLSELHSRQHASFQSVSTTMSEDTAEAMLKGNECIAYYKGTLVWQRVHNASVVMSSEKDHVQMKTVT